MFWTALLLLEDNNCAKLFWNTCINVPVMARTSSIYDHFDLYLTPVTLIFNLPEKCFKWHFSSSRATTVQNYFWNPCINVQVMARTSSIYAYDHFDFYLTPVTLTFNLPKNVSNGTSPPQGQHLCQIVLKTMYYCTSYGPDSTKIKPPKTTLWPAPQHTIMKTPNSVAEKWI